MAVERLARLAAVVAIGLGLACGENPDDRLIPEPPTWVPEIMYRIGEVDGPGAINQPGHVVLDESGRIYATQVPEGQIVVFDGTGSRILEIGRRGEGPGEFQFLGQLTMSGDTLYATDDGLRRVNAFTRTGAFLSSWFWASDILLFDDGASGVSYTLGPTVPQVLLRDGTGLVKPIRGSSRRVPDPPLSLRYRQVVLHIERDGMRQDSVYGYEIEQSFVVVSVGQRDHRVAVPFAGGIQVELMGDGSGFVVVETVERGSSGAVDDGLSVRLLAPDGAEQWSRLVQRRPVEMSSSLLRREAEAARARAAEPRPSAVDIEQAWRRAGVVPSSMPPVEAVRTTQDGRIWIKRSLDEADVAEWLVLDRDGFPRGRLRLPHQQTVVAALDSTFVAVETGAFGVPYLVRYRIVTP